MTIDTATLNIITFSMISFSLTTLIMKTNAQNDGYKFLRFIEGTTLKVF